MAIDITFDKVTNATTAIDGDGYFDTLMRTLTLHIERQFEANRIKGTDYATVYLGAMQSALQQAVEFALKEPLQEAQIDLLTTQESEMVANGTKDRGMKDAQTALYTRQTAGFDDNKNQKLFEAQLNSWGLMYSSGTLTDVPSIISNDAVSTLYSNLTA